jgi:hypothetical protein
MLNQRGLTDACLSTNDKNAAQPLSGVCDQTVNFSLLLCPPD